jgi:CrcB protein
VDLIGLAVGGAAGTLCRYWLTMLCLRMLGPRFAFGTLIVNVSGCLVIGFLMHLFGESAAASRTVRLTLTTGFLGGFTTFSTFGYETVRYWESGETTLAFANIAANVVLGVLATWVGLIAARAAL